MRIETNWDGFMVVSAVRYCLGRHSYAPGVAMDFLRSHWDQLSDKDQGVILRDLDEELARHDRGLSLSYEPEWRSLAEELRRRKR